MASSLLTYAQAAEAVRSLIAGLRVAGARRVTDKEPVPLAQAAGRVLAQPVHADRDQPPFARSTRDGFACRAGEASSHQFLRLVGLIRAGQLHAGHFAPAALAPGEACEIMTGAPVPEGADAVFMVEHSEHGGVFVRLLPPRTLAPGDNIVPQGAEARAGDLLLEPGVRLGPAHIALAAQCGLQQLSVFGKPRVAILATGDELVPVEATPGPSQIRNSNSPMLAALVDAAWGETTAFVSAPDDERSLDLAVAVVLDLQPDLLLITGGISAGKFDLVEDALLRAGARFLFRGVAIQPGKPVAFAELPRPGRHTLPVLALPGNPVSSAVTFHLFAAPMLAALGGDAGSCPRFALARLSGDWRGKPGLTRFLPAWCDFALEPQVRLIPWQGSGDIAAFARSNCFAVIPDDALELPEGSTIRILLS